MISLVDSKKDKEAMLALCGRTEFGCKIASTALAYGFDKSFSCFWMDEGKKTVYCMMDELMIIAGTVLEPEETREFLRAVGAKAVMCAVRNAESLGLKTESSGDVLSKLTGKCAERPQYFPETNIREVYALLESEKMVDDFEPFYLDLSHKLRHGAALAVTKHEGDELQGVALISSIARNSAILSAIVVKEKFRRMGIGAALVREIEAQLPETTIYVFREKNKNKEFYASLGYHRVNTWVYGR